MGGQIKGITIALGAETKAFKSGLAELNKSTKALQNELRLVNKALKFDPSNVDMLKQKQELLAKSSSNLQSINAKQSEELRKLQLEYKNVAREKGKNSEETKDLRRKISELNAELSKNQKEVNLTAIESSTLKNQINLLEDSAKSTENSFSIMKLTLANLTANAIMDLTRGIKELGKNFVKVGADFESSLSEVKAISGATINQMDLLSEKAKELGSKTKFSASESAEAFKYMAMAGWEVDAMLNSVDGVLNLAAASGTDLATTSDIITDAMTGFKLSSKETSRFVDVLATVSSSANTNVN